MTFCYATFGVMFLILIIGTIIEDRRHTHMEQTVKAILARFSGNAWAARQYCSGIVNTTTNPHLKHEYELIEIAIQRQMKDFKVEGAHAS